MKTSAVEDSTAMKDSVRCHASVVTVVPKELFAFIMFVKIFVLMVRDLVDFF